MDSIYFIDEEHKRNYKETLIKWPNAKTDAEYKSACYIMSLPMVFDKISEFIGAFEEPVAWIWKWEWKHTLSKLPEYQDDDGSVVDETELEYDLSSSMIQMGKLALNLWNGYEHFNLMDCVSRMDEEHYKVMKCAIDIRVKVV